MLVALFAGTPARAADDPPRIQAPAAIAVEVTTGDVVFARRADETRAIASTTKLMTALLVFEDGATDRRMPIPAYDGSPAESLAHLHPGDRMTVSDVLTGLLLPSGNDAAVALARFVGGSVPRFVERMNERARELKLKARFRNPIGLDAPGHRASPADLVKLTLLLRRYPEFRRIVDRRSARLTSASPPITVVNRNRLVQGVPWVDGVKTGHTRKAGYALVGSGRRNGVSVITVVLGDPSEDARDADSLALLRYAIGRYHRVTPLRKGAVVGKLPLRYRDQQVEIVAADAVRRIARRDERLRTRVLGLPSDVEGPLPAGSRLGTIEVLQRGRVVARIPAVTRTAVAQASVWQRADDELGRPLVQFLLVLAVLCAGALVWLLRRSRGTHGAADGAVS
ncbi:D-alanyl-D-alanine carboxypeptidase family protein [Patulibacter defluvii]|uniref:D-alanyl-D-alanine carboxypeptidase family protein n=1 Tax=Patulibacter defluvii TaxID=3095358 RepID=UPI002A759C70|nr:D-alanyl-D-alanine carboxypeptidase family protein [Patulibacter sp. DM4]